MKKAIFPIITIMILLLAGCTFAFKTNVTVEVQIDGVDESSFDNDIFIFAFRNAADRDSVYDELLAEAQKEGSTTGDFDSYLYSQYKVQGKPSGSIAKAIARYVSGGSGLFQDAEGTAATMTIEWTTTSPEYGEDYDSPYIYLLAAGEGSDGKCYLGQVDAEIHSSGSSSVLIRIYDTAGLKTEENV